MKKFSRLTAIILFFSVIIGVLAVDSYLKNGFYPAAQVAAQTENNKMLVALTQTGDSWLKGNTDEKLAQIEKHLRGLDVAMAEIGYRYGELHHAVKEKNWDYAKYQTEKIELALRLALERRPKRAASSQTFLN